MALRSRRVLGELEEGRDVEPRRKWGATGEAALNRRVFRFHMLQAALNVFPSLPLLIACQDPAPGIWPLEWLGVAIWAVGLAGETLADRRLARCKADPATRGRV